MERSRDVHELVEGAINGRFSRRDVLRRAIVLGLSIPAIAALLAACGDDDDDDDDAADAEDPTPTEAATDEPTPTEAEGEDMDGEMTLDNPPAVANAEQASEYSGVRLRYYGDTVGIGAELDQALAAKFTEETGIEVEVIPKPESATENFSTYARLFQGQSSDIDVMMLDVIWPGSFAPHLIDLNEYFSDDEKAQFYDTIINNNTVDGKFVALPWFGDFGMLYYRTDLLEKYGYDGPPETWDDLEEMAQTIMEGEQEENSSFVGFVFQGNAYEGLTCDGLEWQASSGGGTIVENGEVTLDNDSAIAIFEKAAGWVDTISPRGVTTYQEEDARQAFQGGNAAFMRNWPYAYALGNADDSPIAGNFDVAPLPAQEGNDHVGTVGGWQLAVSEYSENKEAAVEFIRYMTSLEVQIYRGVVGSYVPTMPEAAEDERVLEAMPFLETLADVVRVTRPSSEARDLYNEVSTAYFQGLNEILNGSDAADTTASMAEDIADILEDL